MTDSEWFAAYVVGLWLGALGVASLLAAVWAWAVAERAGATGTSVSWIGPDFVATGPTSYLLLAAVAGVAGSFVHSASVFAARAGRQTFETSFFWWYILRPLEAALVSMVFVVAIQSGLIAIGSSNADPTTPMLVFLTGALAGLFTDRVMQRLRRLLGATKTDERASEQPPPETAATLRRRRPVRNPE